MFFMMHTLARLEAKIFKYDAYLKLLLKCILIGNVKVDSIPGHFDKPVAFVSFPKNAFFQLHGLWTEAGWVRNSPMWKTQDMGFSVMDFT